MFRLGRLVPEDICVALWVSSPAESLVRHRAPVRLRSSQRSARKTAMSRTGSLSRGNGYARVREARPILRLWTLR